MKGFVDLVRMPFGTVIYDLRDGEKGIVGCLEDDGSIHILWEKNGGIEYTHHDDYIEFSLEKPKKKVKKEVIRHVSEENINKILSGDSYIQGFFDVDESDGVESKITITYETEG